MSTMLATRTEQDPVEDETPSPRPRWVAVALFLAAIYVLGVTSLMATPDVSRFALWWPAAGLGVAMLVLAPRRWSGVLAIGLAIAVGLANLTAGRPASAALGFGLSNAAETALVAYWMTRGVAGRPSLRTQDDLWRLLSGTLVGITVMGLGGGLTAVYLLDGSFLGTVRALMASHAAAILVIVPLALAIHEAPLASRRREALAQWGTVVITTAYVFSPVQGLALAFVPMPFLMWASLRLGTRAVSWQLLALGVMASAMSALGWGPFAFGAEALVVRPETTAYLVQAFLIACALVTLPLAVAVEQRRTALAAVTASEELFRKSFSESLVGMVLLRHSTDGLRIVELNGTAAEILGGTVEELEDQCWSRMVDGTGTLDEITRQILAGEITGWRDELNLAGDLHRRLSVSLSPLTAQREDQMFAAQMIDITSAHDAGERLRTETEFTAAVMNTTGSLIITVDADGIVVGMNPAAERASGHTEAEVMGQHLWEVLVPPDDRPATKRMFAPGRRMPRSHEGTLLTRDGDLRQVMWTSAQLNGEQGSPTHVVMTGIDVTEERTAQTLVNQLLESGTSAIDADLESAMIGVGSSATPLPMTMTMTTTDLPVAAPTDAGRHRLPSA